MFQFADSCDHLPSARLTEKYVAMTGTFGAAHTIVAEGRNGTNCLKASNNNQYAEVGIVNAPTELIVAFAYKNDGWTDNLTIPLWLLSGTGNIAYFYISAGGTLSAYRGLIGGGSVFLATSSAAIVAAAYGYLEFRVKSSATVGEIEIRSNDVVVLTYAGNVSGGAFTSVRLGGSNSNSGTTQRWDDILIMDTVDVGDGYHTFKGDVQVRAHFPTAVGTYAEFTRGGTDSGANWSQVDEVAANGDTDTVLATLTGKKDSYRFEALKTPGQTILGVQAVIEAKKTEAGVATLGAFYRSGGVDVPPAAGRPLSLGSYQCARQFNALNPATGLAWTEADFNLVEAGPYKKT